MFILKKLITGDYLIFENNSNVMLRPPLCISAFFNQETEEVKQIKLQGNLLIWKQKIEAISVQELAK